MADQQTIDILIKEFTQQINDLKAQLQDKHDKKPCKHCSNLIEVVMSSQGDGGVIAAVSVDVENRKLCLYLGNHKWKNDIVKIDMRYCMFCGRELEV